MDYDIVIRKLSDEDGGGYMAHVPDLYGCMSDGETPEEAVANVQDAINDWIEVSLELGRSIPEAGSAKEAAREHEKAVADAYAALSAKFKDLDGRVDILHDVLEKMLSVLKSEHFYPAWSMSDSSDRVALPAYC